MDKLLFKYIPDFKENTYEDVHEFTCEFKIDSNASFDVIYSICKKLTHLLGYSDNIINQYFENK